jgi:uncharacterized protein involved in exopolysaccharide biosynthesis
LSRHPSVYDGPNEVNVVTLMQVAWRYKLLIGLVGVAGALYGLYVALTTRSIYRAEVVVTEVSNEGGGVAGSLASSLGGLASLAGLAMHGGASQEAVAVLNSRYVTEQFISQHQLVKEILGEAPHQSLWLAVDRFRTKVLSITESKEKGTTTVALQWTNPQLVAQWANDYVALTNEIARRRALDDSSRAIGYLKDQIQKTEAVEVQRALYGLVESETKINMLANTRKEYAFTVVDPAVVPEQRVWPRRTLIVLSSGVLGGLLGLFIALGHNMWRRYGGEPDARDSPPARDSRAETEG